MQTQLEPKNLEKQPALKENQVSSIPVGSRQKLAKNNQHAQHSIMAENSFLNRFVNAPYPDFRYSCPFCGSLDTILQLNPEKETVNEKCLDCNKAWLEKRLQVETKTCLC